MSVGAAVVWLGWPASCDHRWHMPCFNVLRIMLPGSIGGPDPSRPMHSICKRCSLPSMFKMPPLSIGLPHFANVVASNGTWKHMQPIRCPLWHHAKVRLSESMASSPFLCVHLVKLPAANVVSAGHSKTTTKLSAVASTSSFPRTFFRSLSQAPLPVQAKPATCVCSGCRAATRLVAGAAVKRESTSCNSRAVVFSGW